MIIDAAELERRHRRRLKGVRDKKVYIGPETVSLRLMSSCNLRCQYCVTKHSPGDPRHFNEPNFIDFDKFKEIVNDSLELEVDKVEMLASGEPSLHPNFCEMLRCLEQKPIGVRLSTNATFPLDFCSDVVKADHVLINLGATNRNDYKDMHGKDSFDRVIANIERLVFLRDTIKPELIIEINYIVNALNKNQKEKMKDLLLRLGVKHIAFIRMNINEYNQAIALPEEIQNSGNKNAVDICINGWFKMIVREDGSLSLCDLSHQMGNLNIRETSLKEAWFSKVMMNMRLLEKHGCMQELFKVNCPRCCDYDRNIQYLEDLKDYAGNY